MQADSLAIFRAVCSTPELRLMVIGYGFGDDHVNRIIADGAKTNGLTVFLVDPRVPNDTRSILQAKGEVGVAIDQAIVGWSRQPFTETFPPPKGLHRSTEYRRILSEFFDWDIPA